MFFSVTFLTLIAGGYAATCTGNIDACLTPGERVHGQDMCIRWCEMECLGEWLACLKTPGCERCLVKAFVKDGFGDRACLEGMVWVLEM